MKTQNDKERQTGKSWLLIPNRGKRLVVKIPIRESIEYKGVTFNVFTYRRKWYLSESETGLSVVGYFKTKAEAIAAFRARIVAADFKKIKENIKSNFTTKAALETGQVLTFSEVSAD